MLRRLKGGQRHVISNHALGSIYIENCIFPESPALTIIFHLLHDILWDLSILSWCPYLLRHSPGSSLSWICVTQPLPPATTPTQSLPAWLTAPCSRHWVPCLSTWFSWGSMHPCLCPLLPFTSSDLLALELPGHHRCPSRLALSWKLPCGVPGLVYYTYLCSQQLQLDKRAKPRTFRVPWGLFALHYVKSLAESRSLDLNSWFYIAPPATAPTLLVQRLDSRIYHML